MWAEIRANGPAEQRVKVGGNHPHSGLWELQGQRAKVFWSDGLPGGGGKGRKGTRTAPSGRVKGPGDLVDHSGAWGCLGSLAQDAAVPGSPPC